MTFSPNTRWQPQAPDAIGGELVLGVTRWIGNLASWRRERFVIYPAELLERHGLVLGRSGWGKTETVLRIAALAAKVLGWRVYYLDCKGARQDAPSQTMLRFVAAMLEAGIAPQRLAVFPLQAYAGWRGKPEEIFNRFMEIPAFSESYYRDVARILVPLALNTPQGPPQTSKQFLGLLDLDWLRQVYAHAPELKQVLLMNEHEAKGVGIRFLAFFNAVAGKLDGGWAFEDVDAAYVQLDSLLLKEETKNLGRYLLEEFGQSVAQRMAGERRVLLVLDDFGAIAEAANAADLFERASSFGASLLLTGQSLASLGGSHEVARIRAALSTVIQHGSDDAAPQLLRGVACVQAGGQSELIAVQRLVLNEDAFERARSWLRQASKPPPSGPRQEELPPKEKARAPRRKPGPEWRPPKKGERI